MGTSGMNVETILYFVLLAIGLGFLIRRAIKAHGKAKSNNREVEWPPPGV